MATCSFVGCHRPEKAKGLCGAHYWQQSHGKELVPVGLRTIPRALLPNPEKAGTMLVPLAGGKLFAIVDAVDADAVGEKNWSEAKARHGRTSYAQASGGSGKSPIKLHRFVAARAGMTGPEIDHKDGNGLDCRRCNLRPATRNQNMQNISKRRQPKSGYKGVYWHAPYQKWRASIVADGKEHHLGYFADPAKGHEAYVEAAGRLHGEFARTT